MEGGARVAELSAKQPNVSARTFASERGLDI